MNDYFKAKIIHLAFLISTSLFFLTSCNVFSNTHQAISKSGFYFDTVINISLYDPAADSLIDDCFSIAKAYENMLSATIEGSDVWNINHGNSATIEVQKDTYILLESAIQYAEDSEGRIDPTIGPLSALWNFSSQNTAHEIPDSTQISSELSHVNYENIVLSNDGKSYFVSLTDPCAQIDLGFIAKGFIADKMKAYLLSKGMNQGIINLGGNVLTIGSKPDGSAYSIGIRKPFADGEVPITSLSIVDQSVVTSGVYERYFEDNGKIYHHILDTKTGYPVENSLYSVTIVSDSSMDGDALSTTCLLLGLDAGMKLIESKEHCEALFITNDYKLHYTSGLQ